MKYFLLLVFLFLLCSFKPSHAISHIYASSNGVAACNVSTPANPCSIAAADAFVGTGAPAGCVAADGLSFEINSSTLQKDTSSVIKCVHVISGTSMNGVQFAGSGSSETSRVAWISDTLWGASIINSGVTHDFFSLIGFNGTSPGNASGPLNQSFFGTGFRTNSHNVHILFNNAHDFMIQGCASAGVISINGGSPTFNNTDASHNNIIAFNTIRRSANYNPLYGSVLTSHCIEYHGIYDLGYNDQIFNNFVSGITGWCIKIGQSANVSQNNIISNNLLFNCGGGLAFNEGSDSAGQGVMDFVTVTNNLIINNGVDEPGGGRSGISFFHSSGTNWVVTNNMMYGNHPSGCDHHGLLCTCGTPMGAGNGAGNPVDTQAADTGCPFSNPKTDASTAVTFTNFRSDTNSAPDASYNKNNYKILTPGSNAAGGGVSGTCASNIVTPCQPVLDAGLSTITLPQWIGPWQNITGGAPTAPTNVIASLNPFFGFDQVPSVWQPVHNFGTVSASSQTFNVSNPSVDGNASLLSVTSSANSGAFWTANLATNDSTVGLTYDTFIQLSANSSVLGSVEFDMNLFSNTAATQFGWGVRCNQTNSLWQVFNANAGVWVSTASSCSITPSTFHHVQIFVHRVAGDTNACGGFPCQYYDGIVYDGNTISLGNALPAATFAGTSAMNFDFELNVGASGTSGVPVTAVIDKVFVTYR